MKQNKEIKCLWMKVLKDAAAKLFYGWKLNECRVSIKVSHS